MTDTISIVGNTSGAPQLHDSSTGRKFATFSVASTPRRRDATTGEWTDGETSWYDVTAFSPLAENVAASIGKGQRVVVTGRLRLKKWESGEKRGVDAEITADAIGPDLRFGRARFERTAGGRAQTDAPEPPEEPSPLAEEAEEAWAAPGEFADATPY